MEKLPAGQSLVGSTATPPELIWIHCNKCFELYLKKKRRIFLLSCQHIFCESCIQKVEEKKVLCTFCNKSGNYQLLNNNLPSNVKRFFNPRPWKNLENLSKVIPFQLKHRTHFLRGLLKAEVHVKDYEKENNILKHKCKELYLKREKLRNLRLRYEEKIVDLRKTINLPVTQHKSMQNSSNIDSRNISNNHNSSGFFSRDTNDDVNFIL